MFDERVPKQFKGKYDRQLFIQRNAAGHPHVAIMADELGDNGYKYVFVYLTRRQVLWLIVRLFVTLFERE